MPLLALRSAHPIFATAGWVQSRIRRKTIHSSSIGLVEKIVHVTEVQCPGEHRLRLCFDDGTAGEVDFSGEELGMIVWPNGADIAPETLHRLATR
jgi:hypothetical protein